MRVLITGASGFAGSHLAELCRGAGAEVTGLSRSAGDLRVDLTDAAAARSALSETRPERIFHLAAHASVAKSWEEPAATLQNNTLSTLNLLEAARAECPAAGILFAGSSEEYGPVPEDRLPVGEDQTLRPQNPYAASKAATDLLAGFYADAHGLRVVRTRAFNHAGPRQEDTFAMASFARQIAEAEAEGRDAVDVHTGNVAARRDFTDVRDVVRAYWLAAERCEPGVYNVCSGRSTSIGDILAGLASHTHLEVRQHTDPAKVRRHEVMEIRGSNERLRECAGWEPEIPLDDTLKDTLDWWRAQVGAGVGS
jgi:GDP-4-dehydro-6-deoxy-D-mannose reductase